VISAFFETWQDQLQHECCREVHSLQVEGPVCKNACPLVELRVVESSLPMRWRMTRSRVWWC